MTETDPLSAIHKHTGRCRKLTLMLGGLLHLCSRRAITPQADATDQAARQQNCICWSNATKEQWAER